MTSNQQHKHKLLAIIPARGGSKGVPLKNLYPVAGKPLLAYMIEAAIKTPAIERVIVSTENEAIAEVAVSCGAEVVWRPTELATDESSSESALIHVIDYVEKEEGFVPDMFAFLQCTSPLIQPEGIQGAIETLIKKNADSVFTVVPSHLFLWKADVNGEAIAINHDESIRQRRQVIEHEYVEIGAAYIMKTDGFRKAQHRFFGKTIFHVIPEEHAVEIDNMYEVEVVESIMRYEKKIKVAEKLPNNIKGVAFDFDGVFTNNKVYLTQDGEETVMCDRSDGMGIALLKKTGIVVAVFSSEENKIVRERCNKLNIECYSGVDDKKNCLALWMKKNSLDRECVIFVGNDTNDIECLEYVGCGIVVDDACDEAKNAAKAILSCRGGNGAIRELVDLILKNEDDDARNK